MPRNRIDANVRCPSCNGQLFPRVLVCDSCGLKVEGNFVMNEFGALTPDELHFLRVFIYCEGRIRDMEAAPAGDAGTTGASVSPRTADEVLDGLEAGQISYKEAIRLLRAKKKEEKSDG